jgi:hypothetical protein
VNDLARARLTRDGKWVVCFATSCGERFAKWRAYGPELRAAGKAGNVLFLPGWVERAGVWRMSKRAWKRKQEGRALLLRRVPEKIGKEDRHGVLVAPGWRHRTDRPLVEAVCPAKLYRRVGGFENELRALAGVREAVRQRLEAVKAAAEVEVPLEVVMADGSPLPRFPGTPKEPTIRLSPGQYWAGVPTRYRDPERFTVAREVYITLPGTRKHPDLIAVHDLGGRLVWTSDGSGP